jgi:Tol biopolymer transport system component
MLMTTLRLILRPLGLALVGCLLATAIMTWAAPRLAGETYLLPYASTQGRVVYELYLMDIGRGLSFRILSDVEMTDQPSISADGRYVVTDYNPLTLVDLKYDTTRTFDDYTHRDWRVIWSPQSDRFAYLSGEDAALVIQSAVGAARRLDADGRLPVQWSPEGERLTLRMDDIFTAFMTVASSEITVPAAFGEVMVYLTDWSARGDELVYVSRSMTSPPVYKLNLLTADDEALTLGGDLEWVTNIDWSPDGRYIAYVMWEGPAKRIFVTTLSPDGREIINEITVPIDTRQIQWTPDSRRLLFVGQRDSDIYIIDAVGSNLRRLTDNDRINVLLGG